MKTHELTDSEKLAAYREGVADGSRAKLTLPAKPKTQHTPGPWGIKKAVRGYVVTVGPRNASLDCIHVGASGGPEEMQAMHESNARLIASAPELLEALTQATDTMARKFEAVNLAIEERDGTVSPQLKLIRDCRAAIAKATGAAQ